MEVHHHPHAGKKRFKEYFLEFLMIFLAVTLGFFAENIREMIGNREKEKHFIANLTADLQVDTAELVRNINYNGLESDMLDSAIKIPLDRLANITTQDSFFHDVFLYYSYVPTFSSSMNTISELRAGGFNVIHDQSIVDSINSIYQFYDREVNFDTKYTQEIYWDVCHKMQAIMQLPPAAVSWDDPSTRAIPVNQRIFLTTDPITLVQLYNVLGNSTSSLKSIIIAEKKALIKVNALINYLKNQYSL